MNRPRLPLSVAVVVFTILSCSKSSQSPVPVPQGNADPFLTAARAFFQAYIYTSPPDNQPAPFRSGLHKTPQWDFALHERLGGRDVLAVPVSIAEPLFVRCPGNSAELPASALTWLLLYRDDELRWQAEVITKIPDVRYLDELAGPSGPPSSPAFTGTIRVEDWQGHFLRGFSYDNTSVKPLTASRLYGPTAGSRTPLRIQPDEAAAAAGPNQGEICDETDWYACSSVGEEDMTCQYEYTEEDCTAPAPASNEGGTSTGGTGGTGSALSGAAYALAGAPLPPGAIAKIIADTSISNNPIVECVYSHLMSSLLTQGLRSILSGFADNDIYNVTFSVAPDLELQGTMVDGETKYLGNNQFDIILNGSEADDPEYSRIYLAATIIHEAFHAKLRQMALATFGTDVVASWPTSIDNMTLSELANYFEQNSKAEQNWNSVGHDWMITNIDELAGSLREYVQTFYHATFASVGDSLAPYEALMYMGLQNTTLYQEEVVGKGLESYYQKYWGDLNEGGKCND